MINVAGKESFETAMKLAKEEAIFIGELNGTILFTAITLTFLLRSIA